MAEAVKAAIAFDNFDKPFVRFGKMDHVRVYEIEPDEIIEKELLDIPDASLFKTTDGNGCPGKNEPFLNEVAALLTGCKFRIVGETGGQPGRVLLRHGINVLEQQGEVAEVLSRLQAYLGKSK